MRIASSTVLSGLIPIEEFSTHCGKPLKVGDVTTATTFRTVLRHSPDVQMLPITQTVLEKAASLRATMNIKTPDAIHAATALLNGCGLFVTNDSTFRRFSDLAVTVLSEIVPLDGADNASP